MRARERGCRAIPPGVASSSASRRRCSRSKRGATLRGDDRVRDVGRARRQCVERRPRSATRGPATATPPATRGHGHPTEGWWDELIGPGRALDTDRWFVVCANVLGGCQGSTGPASPHPVDGRPYGSRFPVLTIRDMVRAQARLADPPRRRRRGTRSSAGRWAGCRSSSGRSCSRSGCARSCPIATCAQATAQQIAWGAHRPPGDPARSEVARRRLLRRGPR